MVNLYSRETVLKNISGRSKYISTVKETKKEYEKERIVLHEKNMKYNWEEYARNGKNHHKLLIKTTRVEKLLLLYQMN